MQSLEEMRTRLDAIDETVLELLAKRFAICGEVAEYKLRTGMPMMQPQRIEVVMNRVVSKGQAHALREPFVRALYGLIINEACELEEDIMARNSAVDGTGGNNPGAL